MIFEFGSKEVVGSKLGGVDEEIVTGFRREVGDVFSL